MKPDNPANMLKISIIIPVYNEAGQIGKLLDWLKKFTAEDTQTDILVVDGGSTDSTAEEVKSAGVRIIQSPKKGRAAQMNFGVRESTGDVIYFLHADTFPPENITTSIRSALNAGKESGCSRLRFDEQSWVMKFYAWFTRFDLLPFRFGDQGLFVKRDVFVALNGFREELVVMEDNEMIRLLRKRGSFVILPDYVTTSARKYRENGFLRLQVIFSIIFALHYAGASQQMLVRFYKDVIKGSKI